MRDSGKELEKLVREIESYLLPYGFEVKTNDKVYNNEGIQIAEFDIEISGILGSTHILWLIECRDRPSSGSAPGSWIEQLVGRRERFGFNKITAVSTTGFSQGALDYAKKAGIETRTVNSISISDVWDWFRISETTYFDDQAHLENITLIFQDIYKSDEIQKINNLLQSLKLNTPIFVSNKTGELSTGFQLFQSLIYRHQEIFSKIEPNQEKIEFEFRVQLPEGELGYHIKHQKHDYNLLSLIFSIKISRTTKSIPLKEILEYKSTGNDVPISQLARFDVELKGNIYDFQFQKLHKTGEIKVQLKKKE